MVLRLHALSNWLWNHKIPVIPRVIYLVIRIVFSAVVPPSATIGRGVTLGYAGLGIVIHRRAVIGDNVNIGPKVTIGGRSGLHGVPVIGEGVLIGSGAQIIGPVVIGARAHVGANAVVICDVPADCVAVGVPARIIERRSQW